MYSQEVKCIGFLLGQPDGFFFVFFFSPYNTLCASGPHREVVGSVYPQKQEPHLGHTVLGYSAWPGPSSPASCFDTAPPFSAAVKKKRPQVARQPVTKLFFFLAVLYFQFLVCEFDLIKTNHNIWPISAAIICSGRAGWYHQCWLCLLWLTCLLFPAAIELRFMPDPPTLNQYGVQRMNKSDNLELTCRYV